MADRRLADFGEDGDPTALHALFLGEYLARADPEVLAAFSTPPGTELVTVAATLRRPGVAPAGQLDRPLPFHCVVTPIGKDRWVSVLGLDHVFVVRAPETVAEAAPAEIQLMLGALDPDGTKLLDFLPPGVPRLVPLAVAVPRGVVSAAEAADLRRRVSDAARKQQALEVLESVAEAVHLRADVAAGPPIVAREAELATLDALLATKERHGVLLVGPELAGKSALLLAWIRAARDRGDKPLVFATSGAQLIAGMSGLGQWQARVARVMDAAETLDAVLWLENLGDLFGARESQREDLAGALRPWLDDRKVRLVGELRPESVALYERRHPGFFEALHRVRVAPLSPAATAHALRDRAAHAARATPDRPTLTPDAIAPLIDLCERYLPYRAFPGKAVRLADELAVIHADERTATGAPVPIGPGRVRAGFSLQSGIPELLLDTQRPLDLDRVAAFFHARVVGQRAAIARLVDLIAVIKAGLQPQGKPLAALLFAGPTGVGKTELARALATFLFGSPDRLARFDMSEYMDPWAAERLIRGAGGKEGVLTRKVRTAPFSVLLLDEIEKAHPAVFDLLLQVLGEGRLTDAAGRTASFENAIIIMTSNLGAGVASRRPIGLAPDPADHDAHYVRAVAQTFRPELVNRLDRIVPFAPLGADEIAAITRLAIDQLGARRALAGRDSAVAARGVALTVSDAAVATLARGGFEPRYGARALRRHLEQALIGPLATELLTPRGSGRRVSAVAVDVDAAGALSFGCTVGAVAERSDDDVIAIQGLRRKASAVLALDAVVELRERLAYLDADVASGASADLAGRLREHAQLERRVQALLGPWTDLLLLEELALTGATGPDEVRAHAAFAPSVYQRFCEGVFGLLAGSLERTDAGTFALSELTPCALDRWLPELLVAAAGRGWRVALHRHGTRARAVDDWPADRPWHPAESAETILDWLAGRDRPVHAHLVLRVRGPHAGLLLHLEAGRQRWQLGAGAPPRGAGEVLLTTLLGDDAVPDPAWAAPALQPPSPTTWSALARLPAARVHDLQAGTVTYRTCADERWPDSLTLPYDRYWDEVEAVAAHALIALARADALDGLHVAGILTPEDLDDAAEGAP